MRTTIDIPEHLLQLAKAVAADRGARLADVVSDALREMLDRRQRHIAEPAEVKQRLPISKVKGGRLRNGIDLADSGELNDVLDGLADAAKPPIHTLR